MFLRIGTGAISSEYGSRGAPNAPSERKRRAASRAIWVSSVCQRSWGEHDARTMAAIARARRQRVAREDEDEDVERDCDKSVLPV
ncbi:MAG TPA: hypothetical protein VGK20_17115 [Candidatus Binatia bacterium]